MEGDFKVGDWLVRPRTNCIVGPDGNEAQLEYRVMELLVFMSLHPDEVLSRECILHAVWPDTFVTDDVVSHAVLELRRAFHDDARVPNLIQTVPKRGYRLLATVSRPQPTIPPYEILERLGQGATSEVFLARDTVLHRKVAIKLLLPCKRDEVSGRKRLLREARVVAALDHPFICRIHHTGEVEGRVFIVMEYVEGQTLTQKWPDSTRAALTIATMLAEGLATAHKEGIVHRNLNPSNVKLVSPTLLKILDFGLAKRVPDSVRTSSSWDFSSRSQADAKTFERMLYLSPEQLRGEPPDCRSDLFSLGIMLYRMLTGAHPFQRKTRIHTVSAVLSEDCAPLSRYMDSAPAGLEQAVARALAKDPASRYQSALELKRDLSALLQRC